MIAVVMSATEAVARERPEKFRAGACFSKVPKPFEPISGATIPFNLRNAEVLSHQTLQSSWFSLH